MSLESYKPPSKKCSQCMYHDSTQNGCIIGKAGGDCRFFFPNR